MEMMQETKTKLSFFLFAIWVECKKDECVHCGTGSWQLHFHWRKFIIPRCILLNIVNFTSSQVELKGGEPPRPEEAVGQGGEEGKWQRMLVGRGVGGEERWKSRKGLKCVERRGEEERVRWPGGEEDEERSRKADVVEVGN